MPYVIRTTVSVRGESAGIQVPDLGKRSSEGKFCRWKREVVQNGDGVDLTVTIQTVRGVHDAEYYTDFRAELVEAAGSTAFVRCPVALLVFGADPHGHTTTPENREILRD